MTAPEHPTSVLLPDGTGLLFQERVYCDGCFHLADGHPEDGRHGVCADCRECDREAKLGRGI